MPVMDEVKYSRLLSQHAPRVISTDREHDHFAEVLLRLTVPKRRLSPEEEALAALLARLLDDYDERTVPTPANTTPVELLRDLMQEGGLRQVDLVDIFGTPSVVSEVLSGKRQISKTHARRLAERFAMPMSAFL